MLIQIHLEEPLDQVRPGGISFLVEVEFLIEYETVILTRQGMLETIILTRWGMPGNFSSWLVSLSSLLHLFPGIAPQGNQSGF